VEWSQFPRRKRQTWSFFTKVVQENTIKTGLRPGHELETGADSLTGSGTQQNVLPIARESVPKR
jgi:hypothetical protein